MALARSAGLWSVVVLSILPAVGLRSVAAEDLDDSIVRFIESDEGGAPKAKAPGNALKLSEAEKLAQDNDPVVKSLREKSGALSERAISAASLNDPKVKFGISEYPLRKSGTGDDPIRMVLGLQQEVSPGEQREQEGAQMQYAAQAQDARALEQRLLVTRELRKAWLNVYLQYHTVLILRQSEKLFAQLLQVTQYQYRAGAGTQQGVYQAQLELSLLKDRTAQADTAREAALADLVKWTGPTVMNRAMALDALELPSVPEKARIESGLDKHPSVYATKLDADAAKAGVEAARAQGRPNWMWEVETEWLYAKNQGWQSNSVGITATVDLTSINRKERRARWLAASEKEYNATLFATHDQRRELKRMLDAEYSAWRRLDERLAFYRETVLPQAGQNAQAALKAYQSQVSGFDELMRARQTELNSKLDALRMLVERAVAHVNLLYLATE